MVQTRHTACGLILTAALLWATPAWAHERPLPAAWNLYTNMGDDYQAGITDADSYKGRWCAFVKSGLGKPKGFASVGQSFKADVYRGKRLRLTAWLKAINVMGHANLWMRIDGHEHKVEAFDDMRDHWLKGSTAGWKRFVVVLDVPADGEKVNFGIILDGQGTVCIDDLKFDAVGTNVATTDGRAGGKGKPPNTDFEK